MPNHHNGTIPENSIVKVIVNDDFIVDKCIATKDMNVEKHSLVLLSGGIGTPISVDRVEVISDTEFVIYAYWQDCLVVKGGTLFGSYSDAID